MVKTLEPAPDARTRTNASRFPSGDHAGAPSESLAHERAVRGDGATSVDATLIETASKATATLITAAP
jgi:hypothetical protein